MTIPFQILDDHGWGIADLAQKQLQSGEDIVTLKADIDRVQYVLQSQTLVTGRPETQPIAGDISLLKDRVSDYDLDYVCRRTQLQILAMCQLYRLTQPDITLWPAFTHTLYMKQEMFYLLTVVSLYLSSYALLMIRF